MSMQLALRAERDALLAEKSTWVARAAEPAPPADAEEAKRAWEAEKAELVETRDKAQADAKVYTCLVISKAFAHLSPEHGEKIG